MLTLNLNLGAVTLATDRLKAKANVLVERAAADLAAMTYNHIVEGVNLKLHSTRQIYLDNLTYEPAGSGSGWTVTLHKQAMWLEEGMSRHEMIDDLLKSPNARYSSKTGNKYMVIPFGIKGASKTPMSAMPIRKEAMKALKEAKINMKQIEKEVDGRVKTGKLHGLDVMGSPIKTMNGSSQGHGPIGSVRQGMTGIPFLQGLQVRQRMMAGKIQKQAMTFRIVSSSQKGSGKWIHPGTKALKLMDEAHKWASQQWDTTIKKEILEMLSEG